MYMNYFHNFKSKKHSHKKNSFLKGFPLAVMIIKESWFCHAGRSKTVGVLWNLLRLKDQGRKSHVVWRPWEAVRSEAKSENSNSGWKPHEWDCTSSPLDDNKQKWDINPAFSDPAGSSQLHPLPIGSTPSWSWIHLYQEHSACGSEIYNAVLSVYVLTLGKLCVIPHPLSHNLPVIPVLPLCTCLSASLPV